MSTMGYLVLVVITALIFAWSLANFLADVNPNKRYFFISYSSTMKSGNQQIGNLYFSHSEHPSNKWIKDYLVEHDSTLVFDQIVVLNISEFKSKSDFDKFIGNEP